MGQNKSKSEATAPPVNVIHNDAESTNIDDLIKSGRYKVAGPQTLEMMKQIRGSRDEEEPNKAQAESRVQDLRSYIIEQEGLEIGQAKRRALAQQWRFFLSCEPMQRGLDAGIIVGSVAAAVSVFRNKRNRVPWRVAFVFLSGFAVGLITVPVGVIAADNYNARRIKALEKQLFERQREEMKKR